MNKHLHHPQSKADRLVAEKKHERPKVRPKGLRKRELFEEAETHEALVRAKNFGEIDI
jgi:hypothetical protein